MLWRIAGLPLGSSLPISSGKALVQTETRLVSNTRKEQVGWEEALRNQWASRVKSGERGQKDERKRVGECTKCA